MKITPMLRTSLLVLAGTACATSASAGHTNTVLIADVLDGREQVDSNATSRALVGDPDGKGLAYVFGIDGDLTTLCYSLFVNKVQLVPVGEGMMAHIHEGARDANGPVVASLAGPEDGNAADCLTEGEMGKFPTGEAGIVQRILNNPSKFYINVHNPEFPAGAVRGQLRYQLEEDGHSGDEDGGMDMVGAPSVPGNITGQVYSKRSAELFWDRSTDDGVVVSYKIYNGDAMFGTAQGPSFYVNTLTQGTTYNFSVSAIDDEGKESGKSAVVSVTP